MKKIEGMIVANGAKIGIVAARLMNLSYQTGKRCRGCIITSQRKSG